MTFEVTILGSNSALPAHGRHPTSQVINHHEKLFLLDCGEGTQVRLSHQKIKRSKIDYIFITHLHGDHYYGLLGLLTSYHLLRRPNPLHLFGPPGLKEIIDLQFKHSDTRLVYELVFHPVSGEHHEMVLDLDEISVFTLPMNHRIPCCGYLFREKIGLRKIIPEKLEQFGIPKSAINDLKSGKDFQSGDQIIPNREVTTDAALPRTYAHCSDTLYDEALIPLIKGANLLYYETTFMNESLERAVQTFHSTTLQAGYIAKAAGVKKLLIGHFSAKYKELLPMLEETKTVFSETYLATEGETFLID